MDENNIVVEKEKLNCVLDEVTNNNELVQKENVNFDQ